MSEENLLVWAVWAAAAAMYVSSGWALRRWFVQGEAGAPDRIRNLERFGLLFLFVHTGCLVWPGAVRGVTGLAGLALFLLALGLFWWAIRTNEQQRLRVAFSKDDVPAHLVRTGPYAWMRHPFYTSYFLMWLAGTVASRQPLLILTILVMGRFYLDAAREEEAKFRASSLASDYAEYRERTGMFIPFVG